jgi:CheY-like chemotaxis protein/HPt (histidine-containing phosphotransfer) domain-containing protein
MQQGAGLGLTITKKLAEMHNGRVEVTSKFGKGSTFTAYLRLKKGKLLDLPESDNKSDENEAGPLAGVSVLVVEDNELNQVVVCNMLENWGATHAVAKNGQEAISILEAARFHIVLMDLAMPIMDGFEATAYIRSRMSPPASTLPIIALTASAVLDVQKRTLAAGMNDYVSKPFRSKTLLQKILENLKNNVKLPQNADLPNEARGESVLDLSYLREVSSDNDELLLRMLNEAEKNFNEFVKTGSIYIAEQDYTKLRLLAHKIKPVCRYIGSDKMFHEISKIEIAAKNETEKEELLDYYWKFMEAWGESRKLLEAEIARLKKE